MLNDINDFGTVNEVYKECRYRFHSSVFFTVEILIFYLFLVVKQEYPARSTYQVGKLPLGARIEIEAIGLCGNVETHVISD